MLEDVKVLALPLVVTSGVNTDNILKETIEVKGVIKSALESGYKIEATHPMVVGNIGYLVYSLVKEK